MIVAVVVITAGKSCHGFSTIKTAGGGDAGKLKKSSPVLIASEEGGVVGFDIGCVANPVILPPVSSSLEEENTWQCFFYGNAGSWNGGHKCFLPTGSTGLATSKDGLTWTKVAGHEKDGAILTPSPLQLSSSSPRSNDEETHDYHWDSVQIGVGDVIRVGKELHMYYFGGDDEELALGPGSGIVGFRMRIGRAKSFDNGRTWTKDGRVSLDYNESEGLFSSWPRIVTPLDDSNDNESGAEPWMMFYHSFNGEKWRVFGAESRDKGDTWFRTGLVLEGGDHSSSDDAFDFNGIGTRSVTRWRDGLLMIYEGVDQSSIHRLGAAYCDLKKKAGNDSNSNQWVKLNDGLPILEPGKGPLGEWTKQVIGTPFVVHMPDGSLRLYHCAKDGPDGKMAIGVVVSESGDIGPDCWTACN